MPDKVSDQILSNESPAIFKRFPRLIGLQHLASWAMFERLWVVKKFLKREVSVLGKKARVLDVGCGTGIIITRIARQNPQHQFTGCDMSHHGIDMAQSYANTIGIPNLTFVAGDIMDLNPDSPFDLIASASFLQYVKDLELVMSKMHELLAPDGQWIIYQAVNSRRIFPFYNAVRRKWFKTVDYDWVYANNYLSHKELELALKNNGFTIDENYYVYGLAGKVAFELLSFGQLAFMKLPWVLAVLFALVYFPIILVPAWLLMAIDLALVHDSGNGLLLIVSKS